MEVKREFEVARAKRALEIPQRAAASKVEELQTTPPVP